MQNKLPPYDYQNLTEQIHLVFYDFLEQEYRILRRGESDEELLESCTDNILRLIRRQGGQV